MLHKTRTRKTVMLFFYLPVLWCWGTPWQIIQSTADCYLVISQWNIFKATTHLSYLSLSLTCFKHRAACKHLHSALAIACIHICKKQYRSSACGPATQRALYAHTAGCSWSILKFYIYLCLELFYFDTQIIIGDQLFALHFDLHGEGKQPQRETLAAARTYLSLTIAPLKLWARSEMLRTHQWSVNQTCWPELCQTIVVMLPFCGLQLTLQT